MMFKTINFTHNNKHIPKNIPCKIQVKGKTNTKKVIKCGTVLLAASIFTSSYKSEIKKLISDAKKSIMSTKDKVYKKPTIVLLYDSSPCKCEDVACDGQPSHEADTVAKQAAQDKEAPCCCGCELDVYKNIFGKFSDAADAEYIDTSKVSPTDDAKCNSFIDRFELEYVPSVLLLTPNGNLIAKLEAPAAIADVETMLNCYLR